MFSIRKCVVLRSALGKWPLFSLLYRMTDITEPPFRPREKLLERQKYFQSIHKHTYLKGPLDKITSVAIPIALAASSLYLIGRGIYNMSHGIGKKEWGGRVVLIWEIGNLVSFFLSFRKKKKMNAPRIKTGVVVDIFCSSALIIAL